MVFLSAETPGLDQLTKILAREKDIRVLRIFSHGAPGQVVLNGEVIDSRTLARYRESFRLWAQAFAPDADILLYGCNVAETEKGREFVDRLAAYTGADVAASTNRTGGLENEWALEYTTGPVAARSANITGYPLYLATYTVTTNADSGGGSLRQAMTDAETTAEADTIVFNLSPGSETITLASALPDITKDLTIDGDNIAEGGLNVTVQANELPDTATYRVFTIVGGTVVNLQNMTIQNGKGGGAGGGGISNIAATLTVDNCTISGNTAEGRGWGGGILNYGGALTVQNSTISGNCDSYIGGGIANWSGTTTVNNCTISGNTTRYGGGGITSYNGTLTMNNSTISGNTSDGAGGGAYICFATQNISNCTFSENTASQGGGLFNAGNLTLKNSIIANNTVTDSGADYYYYSGYGTLTDSGYNIVEYSNVAATATGGFNDTTDILYNTKSAQEGIDFTSWTQNGEVLANQNLKLFATLAENGGPTLTLALLDGSFAAASETTGIPSTSNWNGSPLIDGAYTDQRGVARTPGQNTSIGAYSENYVSEYYYRSNGDVNWSSTANWQQSADGSTGWESAAAVPDDGSLGISIISGNTATVDNNVTIDQTTVQSGATLSVNTGKNLNIANGDGADLTVGGTLTNAGTLTCADSSEVLFSGASASTFTSSGTTTFKTLTLNKDAAATALNITGMADMTVSTALTVTRGTVNLSGWTHNMLLGGSFSIAENGRWTAHGDTSTHYVQFYGADCTFTDSSSGGPQNLGHVKVDE